MDTLKRNPVDILDKASLAAMNFNVVKRIDSQTEELLASAGHIVLYDWNIDSQVWSHKGVEGTLFLIRRRTPPLFQYIVLNKKSQDHYVEDIETGFKYERSVREGKTFLLYRNLKGEVVGIWFYDSTECDKVVALLDRIGTMDPHMAAQSSAGYSPIPAILPPTSNPQYLKASRGPHSNDTNAKMSEAPSPPAREQDFWDSGTSAHSQTSANKAHSELSFKADAHTPQRPVLDPLQKLFGGGHASSTALAFSQVQAAGPMAPSAAAGTGGPSPASSLPSSVPRLSGLPPFRNAAGATQTSASPKQGSFNLTKPNTHSASKATPTPNPPVTAVPSPFSIKQDLGIQESMPCSEGMSRVQSSTTSSLLKPSFFQAATPRAASTTIPVGADTNTAASSPPALDMTSKSPQAEPQDPLLRLFGPRSTAIPAAPRQNPQRMEEKSMNESIESQSSSHKRSRLREAVRALASSDEFIDIIIAQLEKSGVTN